MFENVTHTWNPIKGKCPHGCSYCYMNNIPQRKTPYLSSDELSTFLGTENFIAVGSSTDIFANLHPADWIYRILNCCKEFPRNRYLFMTKNTERLAQFNFNDPNLNVCATIESNCIHEEFMGKAPTPQERAKHMLKNQIIAIEPIMDFDLTEFIDLIKSCEPKYVYIGADSKRNGLPEPSKEKVQELIKGLESFTKVHLKKNLNRILGA